MKYRNLLGGFVLTAAALVPQAAYSALMVYQGTDAEASSIDPRPNSDAAQASFLTQASSMGRVSTIDFEDQTIENVETYNLNKEVTATVSGVDLNGPGGIRTNGAVGSSAALGYNTTAGGEQMLTIIPDRQSGTTTVTFSFDQPTSGFGAFISGLQPGASGMLSILTDVDSIMEFELGEPDGGGVQYFGFIDDSVLIRSAVFVMSDPIGVNSDDFSIDDVSYLIKRSRPVTEPGVLGLLGLGALGLVARRRKQRRV